MSDFTRSALKVTTIHSGTGSREATWHDTQAHTRLNVLHASVESIRTGPGQQSSTHTAGLVQCWHVLCKQIMMA